VKKKSPTYDPTKMSEGTILVPVPKKKKSPKARPPVAYVKADHERLAALENKAGEFKEYLVKANEALENGAHGVIHALDKKLTTAMERIAALEKSLPKPTPPEPNCPHPGVFRGDKCERCGQIAGGVPKGEPYNTATLSPKDHIKYLHLLSVFANQGLKLQWTTCTPPAKV
jgi:hypothetical protein